MPWSHKKSRLFIAFLNIEAMFMHYRKIRKCCEAEQYIYNSTTWAATVSTPCIFSHLNLGFASSLSQYSTFSTYETELQTCDCVNMHLYVRSCKLIHMSGVHHHVPASSTSDCAFLYFIVQCYFEEYGSAVSSFQAQDVQKQRKQPSDIAGTELPGHHCTFFSRGQIEIEFSREPQPVPSASGMSEPAAWAVSCADPSAPHHLHLLPLPPVSNSSVLFTQCQPLVCRLLYCTTVLLELLLLLFSC